MNYYTEILNRKCFTKKDILQLLPNSASVSSLLARYLKAGKIERVKRDFYVAIDALTGVPICNKYQIATKNDDSSYLSYRSALEYYGLYTQVYNQVIFCSDHAIRPFDFDGISYQAVKGSCSLQIEEKEDGVRVTSLERTVIDCIDRLDLGGGLEEITLNFQSLPKLDVNKLKEILEAYNVQFLYQKTGLLLSYYDELTGLDSSFYTWLESKTNKSTRYLVPDFKGKTYFDSRWNCTVPEYFKTIVTKGILDIDI